jgi:acyl-CoA dehydrogenase
MPSISKTERIALQSGSVGLERHVFAATINKNIMKQYKTYELTQIDKQMLAKVPNLISTVDDYEILTKRHTPKSHPFWSHAKKENFFGLIVPEEYGGVKMSNTGLSKLLQRLASRSPSAQVHVMVPASLGPAELLVHYGTQEQKDYFLPKLARGAIPCFALTSADAGSDAAGSMTDTGLVVETTKGVQIILNCDKRYITLAPVADIIGIAFKIQDPQQILMKTFGRDVDGEITLALIEKDTPNLKIGSYTDPLGIGFANGTVIADNVMLTMDDIIGGKNGLGEGWKYLMEALAAGRGIALPAGACGSSKMLTNAVSGYSRFRKQFKIPIGSFEGVKEKLSDMALKTLEIDGMVALMNSALDSGERPPILSAILKQRTTELGRDVVMHAMDIVAGSAICMGPQNFVAGAYLSSPIGITVEGSNTMTRSLLIFGQGLVRSHPHMLNIINAIDKNDEKKFAQHIQTLIKDSVSLFVVPKFRSDIEKFVQFFALSSNASLVLGGSLKKKEYISGKYADILSFIVAHYAVEWYATQTHVPKHLIEAFHKSNLKRLQSTTESLIENHPHKMAQNLIYRRCVGWKKFKEISDVERDSIVKDMMKTDSETRQLFSKDVLHCHPNVARIEKTLRMSCPETIEKLTKEMIRVDTFNFEDGN